jgi:protoheme IX farnesyltransferase
MGEAASEGAPQGAVALVKPRVLLLLLLTGMAAAVVADPSPDPARLGWLLLGGLLTVASANVFNNLLDRGRDSLMERTMWRPLPAGTVSPGTAMMLSLLLGVAGLTVLWNWVNALTAALAGAGMWYYILVYTAALKPRTPQNIVLGGVAGAFPPLVGWAAVDGTVGIAPVLMGLLVVLWTPPHFWSLAILYEDDYRRAGVPMMPVVRGAAATRALIAIYTVALVVASLVLAVVGGTGAVFLAGAVALAAPHLWLSVALVRQADTAAARRLFKFSSVYLAALFALLVADALVAWPLPWG